MGVDMGVPLIVVVGADKGGVGKTTVARALLDYFKGQGMVVRAFDTESETADGRGVLKRFHPAAAEIVDLTKSDGMVAVFDNLAACPVTLIDIRAGLLTPTLKVLGDLGLMEMARQGTARIAVLHVIGSSVASFEEIRATAAALLPGQHFVVKNHMNDAEFFAGIDAVAKDALKASIVLEIPKLDGRATEHVDAASQSFVDFVADPAASFTMKGLVRTWLSKVFAQFEIARLNR
jgi:hypothetical protein